LPVGGEASVRSVKLERLKHQLIVFAYLFLVAQYESWTIPVAALLSVVVDLFGAMVALKLSRLDNNLYAQIALSC
jgi:multidrug efflux pump subunit AcrB